MAAQNPYGVRQLTEEERLRVAATQAQYQQGQQARQAERRAQFDQTLATGLAGQAGRPGVPAQPALLQPMTAPSAPATPATPAPVTPAAPAPTMTNAQVLAADRANLQAMLPPTPGAQPATTLSPNVLADANQRIAATLQGARDAQNPSVYDAAGNLQGASFNAANTSRVDAAGNITSNLRGATGSGLTFGFGENGAPTAQQVLQNYAAQDAAAGEARQVRIAEAQQRADLSRLRDLEGDPVAYRQALRTLQVTAPQLTAARENLAQGQQAALTAETNLAIGAQRNEAGLTQAQMDNLARLEAAGITGQYGVAAQRARGQQAAGVELLKAMSPQGENAAAQAELRRLQLSLATSALERGDTTTAASIATGAQPKQTRVALDALGNPIGVYDAAGTFVPYSAEELAAVRQASAASQGR